MCWELVEPSAPRVSKDVYTDEIMEEYHSLFTGCQIQCSAYIPLYIKFFFFFVLHLILRRLIFILLPLPLLLPIRVFFYFLYIFSFFWSSKPFTTGHLSRINGFSELSFEIKCTEKSTILYILSNIYLIFLSLYKTNEYIICYWSRLKINYFNYIVKTILLYYKY